MNAKLGSVVIGLLIAACTAGNGTTSGAGADPNTGGSGGNAAGGNNQGGQQTQGGGGTAGSSSQQFMAGGATGTCNNENGDEDQDGWTIAEGDCNDCDKNANPGAIEVIGAPSGGGSGGAGGTGGTGGSGGGGGAEYEPVDEDCDGVKDEPQDPYCDDGLALNSSDAKDGARAVDICKQAANAKDWGLLTAQYTRANGTPIAANKQVGLQANFGPNVNPLAGSTMLSLSSGFSRLPGQPGACTNNSCNSNLAGTPPPGFPQDVPNCPIDDTINDDIALDLTLRAPTNATGYKFNFKFHSFEYGEYVCTTFNDQFIALVNPPPQGAQDGNISFDALGNPVSVNIAFFDVCASCADFAANCFELNCPSAPVPCCPAGPSQLMGTGFDNGFGSGEDAGGTSWLQTQAPVVGGSEFAIRFAIWDTGDSAFDSTVIVDSFEWIANGGTVPIGTTPVE